MAQKFVGIDLGNRRVKITVASAGLRGAQVNHVWEQVVPDAPRRAEGTAGDDNLDAVLDVALRMVQERGLRHLPTAVSLPGGAASFRVLHFPFEDPRQIAQAMQFEADGQFPLPIEQLALDHMPIKRGDGKGRALVVAVKRSVIEHLSARFKLAGVDLRVITSSALAIAQALAGTVAAPGKLGEGERMPVVLVVDLGYRSTDVIALAAGGPLAVRSLRRGSKQLARDLARAWRLDPVAAELALERDARVDDEVVARAMQPILRELEHSRQWLRTELAAEVVELRLCGGLAKLGNLVPWLAQQTGLPVSLAVPRESAALHGVAGHDWTTNLVALGTSLSAGRRPLIQLFDSFEGATTEGQWFQQHFSTFAALGVAVLAFAAIDTMVRVRAAERERDAYVAELERETDEVFGTAMTEAQQVRLALAALEGGDLSSEIPERGALELLELITKAATPKGGRVIPPPGSSPGIGPDGSPTMLGPDGSPLPGVPGGEGGEGEGEGEEGGPAEQPAVELAPVSDPNAGIVGDDALVFASIDIRELKIEMSVSATRATAQDRLAVKLQELGCVRKISKGMIKDRNELKSFEMVIDHNCFSASLAQNEPEPTEQAPTPAAEDEEDDDGQG